MNTNISPIKAVVVAVPWDGPTRVADVVFALHNYASLEISVTGCAARSSWEFLPTVPLPAVGVGSATSINHSRDIIEKRFGKVAKALDETFPEGEEPKLGYVEGLSSKIAVTLSSIFDLVVVPHPLELPNMFRLWFPNFDTWLALSKPAPTLFCRKPPTWKNVIVCRIRDSASWWATQILSRIGGRLGISVYQWFPYKSDTSELLSSINQRPVQFPKSNGISQLDVAAIPGDQQPDICLVVSANVVRSIFRYRKVRRVLSQWRGSCLVWL